MRTKAASASLALAMLGVVLTGAPARGAELTFANTAAVSIRSASSGTVLPYPTAIDVSGVRNATAVTATFHGYGHVVPHNTASLLVAPNGKTVVLHSDVGGNDQLGSDDQVSGLTLTFSDGGGSMSEGGPLTSGTYKPTRHSDTENRPNNFDAPAPAPPSNDTRNYGTTMAGLLAGGGWNGKWKLFVDNYGNGTGSITGGWSLTFTTTDSTCATATERASARCDAADWTVDFSIFTVGLQSDPEPEQARLRTETVGSGTFRFEKKPRRGEWTRGIVTDFELDHYDFYDSAPDSPQSIEFREHPSLIRGDLKIGRDMTKIRRLPFIVTLNIATSCGLEPRNMGTLTAVEGEIADGIKVNIDDRAHLACFVYHRAFYPGPNPQGPGLSTVTVNIGDPVQIPGNAP